jgi:hypothetical protein
MVISIEQPNQLLNHNRIFRILQRTTLCSSHPNNKSVGGVYIADNYF